VIVDFTWSLTGSKVVRLRRKVWDSSKSVPEVFLQASTRFCWLSTPPRDELTATRNLVAKLLTLSHPCDLARQTCTRSPTSASSNVAIPDSPLRVRVSVYNTYSDRRRIHWYFKSRVIFGLYRR